jgi:hypothetical protein
MKNIVEAGRPQMTICRMRIACRITKATHTHTLTLTHTHTLTICNIIAFPLQKQLHERASVLLYTYIAACLVKCYGC